MPYIIKFLHNVEKMETDSEKGNLSMDQLVMETLENNKSIDNLKENAYVMGNKANYDWLMESIKQLNFLKI